MKNILAKLHKIQHEISYMKKDGMNKFQNYAYLSEAQVTEQVKKILDKEGVIFIHSSEILNSFEISPTSKGTKQFVINIKVSYKFYDKDTAEFIEGSVVGQGSDTADKGVYKAITGAIKYIFMKNFLIPTGDDPEKDNEEHIKEEIPQEIQARANDIALGFASSPSLKDLDLLVKALKTEIDNLPESLKGEIRQVYLENQAKLKKLEETNG